MQGPVSDRGRRCLVLLVSLGLPLVAAAGLLLRPAGEALATPVRAAAAGPAVAASPVGLAVPTGGETVRLRSGGRDRAVLVQRPTATGPARGLVLVLGPHALTATRAAHDLRLDDLRAAGYVVAYPSTVDGDWDAGRCCGDAQRARVDDVGFLQDVRRLLLRRSGVAPSAVGLVGYSTGGQMAYRVLCEHPEFAGAAVVVAGSLEAPCRPTRALPATLVVHGLRDSTVPWAFSTHRTGLLDYAPTPALASIEAYAHAAGCGAEVLDRTDGRSLMGWSGCRGIPQLTAVGMPGTGHGWASLHGSTYVTRFLPAHLGRP